MGNVVAWDLLARDKVSGPTRAASKSFDEAADKAGHLGKAFGAVSAGSRGLHTSFGLIGRGAALAAGAAGIGGLIESFKGIIGEGREAQKTGAQTAAVIKSTGGIAKVSASQVGALATSISNKVGVDDEAIQSGANLLLTFTGIRNEAGKGNKIFDQATQTVTDMAAAMNNGEVSTSGLKTASIQVGKALNDPLKGITALTKVGVTFDEGQKKQIATMIKHHDRLGAQKIILGELNKEFGGSAEAGTTATQKLGVVFGNIEETIGTALLPAIDSVATWFSKKLPGALAVGERWFGRIKTGAQGLFDLIVKGDFTHNFAKAFHVSEDSSVVDAMLKIRTAVIDAADWIKTTGVPAVLAAFGDIKTKVGEALSGIDLSGIATAFTTQATKWGGAIITGVKTGLDTGDWSGLGQTVGNGLIAAISGATDLASKFGGAVSDLLGKVDWFAAGEAVGRTAFPFLIGFTNTLIDGLFTAAKEHPLDTVLFFASFLGIGKIGGVLSRLLEKIPFLRVFAPLFRGIEKITKPINDAIGRVVGSIGREFLRGLGIETSGMGRRLSRSFDGLRLRIWSFAEGFGKAGLGLVRKAGEGVRAGIIFLGKALADVAGLVGRFLKRFLGPIAAPFFRAGSFLLERLVAGLRSVFRAVSGAISETISRLTAPFRSAGSWLIRKGVDLISGLARGVLSMLRSAAGAVGRVISTVTGKFAGAAGWLVRHGGDLIRGLLNGATSALSGVGKWIKDLGGRIVGAVKSFFQIGSPSKVFAGLGGHLIDGLIKGMLERNPAALVGKVFGGMTGAIRTLFSKNMLGNITNLGGKALSALGGLAGNIFGGGGKSSNSGNESIVRGMAQQFFGWTGSQWTALRALIMGESGFNNTAQNPSSSAYGIFQFLDSTWGGVGVSKSSNPSTQTLGGLRYIKQVYGTPVNAFSAWLNRQPHWYGGGMPPTDFYRPTLIGVGERGGETVTVVPHGRRGAGAAGGGDMYITVNIPAAVGDRAALENWVVSAVRKAQKISGKPITV